MMFQMSSIGFRSGEWVDKHNAKTTFTCRALIPTSWTHDSLSRNMYISLPAGDHFAGL